MPFVDYLRERVAAFPDLTAVRLRREIRERGYGGAYTAVKRFVAAPAGQGSHRLWALKCPTASLPQRCLANQRVRVDSAYPRDHLRDRIRRAVESAGVPHLNLRCLP